MGEVSDEIELDLGLSIGRSFKKSENSKPVSIEPALLNQHPDGERSNVLDADASEIHAPPRSGASVMDPQTKREIHALRRQEAKRKREEKQQKRGQSRARNGEMGGNGGSSVSDDEKAWVNKDQLQSRVRENGDAKGEELDSEEGQCNKKNKMENGGSANLNSNQSNGVVPEQPMGFASSSPYPIMQMQFPYPPIQYMPLSNGFAIPYVMPCWAPNGAAVAGGEKQVAQPVVCRSFVPFQANQITTNGCESEQNGSGGNRKATSNGSPMCSSSVVSDNRSSSHEGGNSSEARSHSSPSLPEQPHIADGAKVQFEHSASSKIVGGTPSFVKVNHVEKAVASRTNEETNGPNLVEKPVATNVAQPRTPESRVDAAPESQPNPANKPKSPSPENPKEVKGEAGKPPKPQTQNQCTPSLPQMPCVSTTGNGPNGKTVTGFLYRYTKTEVSIVCVCHGNSFTPAEFVAHAGGTDISNPLKHITVIPSALG